MIHDIPSTAAAQSYFFTTRLANRHSTLLVDEIDRLRNATRKTMQRYPFEIDAIAVLPAAIHTLWTLPAGDGAVSKRWRMIKSLFAKSLAGGFPVYAKERTSGIWQRHCWEHRIKEEADFETHRKLIHSSPVQAGLCGSPQDWPHSSFHRHSALSDLSDASYRPNPAPLPPNATIQTTTYHEDGFSPFR